MKGKDEKPPIDVDFFEDLTGHISRPAQGDREEIGRRIRRLREEKGLSLPELSRLTGFDVDLLSRIERSEVQPPLGTLIRLSKALDSAFSRLVSGVGDRLYSITRKDERRIVPRSPSPRGQKPTYTYRSLAPEVRGRNMEALVVQLLEDPDEVESVHEGEEFIYVLEGTVAMKIGEERFTLEPGDSAYYLSTTPHVVSAQSGEATILAVVYAG